MNEEQMNRLLMIAGATAAVCAGLGTIGLLIVAALDFTWALLFCTVLLGAATVGFGAATSHYGSKVTGHPLIFTNEAEREVLTAKQRRELRRVRGEVVMERALIEVEHERDNITHRQIEAADDPSKPPYETRWTQAQEAAQLELERKRRREADRDRDRY